MHIKSAPRPGVVAAVVAAILIVNAGPPTSAAAARRLNYVVVISRHGVRAPTWPAERLNQYSAEPWPEWNVPPGNLTAHGRALVKLLGAYYGDWLSSERLLRRSDCQDAKRIYIRADTDQRTLETGRAMAEGLLPKCTLGVHSLPEGQDDPLFDPIASGDVKPDPQRGAAAVRERLGPPGALVAVHRPAFEALQVHR